MANTVGALIPLTKPFDIYVDFLTIAALPDTVYYSFQLVNNESAGLYYQYLSTVTLAGGSTATIAGQAATDLGLVASGANAQFLNRAIADITVAPSANEIETIVVTIKRYTDSGYTALYDTTNLTTINLHMYSSSVAPASVSVTDNFSGNSADGWQLDNSGSFLAPTISNSPYYDATSGYCIWFDNGASLAEGGFPLVTHNLFKAYAISNTNTDALLEIYAKAQGQAGWVAIQVDYSDSSPSDYYIFNIPNIANWFQLVVHAKVGLTNTIRYIGWVGYGLPSAEQLGAPYIGTAKVIVRSAGTF